MSLIEFIIYGAALGLAVYFAIYMMGTQKCPNCEGKKRAANGNRCEYCDMLGRVEKPR